MTEGFTKKYRVGKLIYFEVFADPDQAVRRERQIKAGSRRNKLALIHAANPDWRDLWADIIDTPFAPGSSGEGSAGRA